MPAAKSNSLDLSDLLGEPEGSNVISLDDLVPLPRKAKEAAEVVLFWTEHTCSCGRHFEQPKFHNTMTRYDVLRYGKFSYSQYEPYLPACHANLPRRVEFTHIYIPHCPLCIHEQNLADDYQLDLFKEEKHEQAS